MLRFRNMFQAAPGWYFEMPQFGNVFQTAPGRYFEMLRFRNMFQAAPEWYFEMLFFRLSRRNTLSDDLSVYAHAVASCVAAVRECAFRNAFVCPALRR